MNGWNLPPGVLERDIPGYDDDGNAERHLRLTLDFIEAATNDPTAEIQTPGYKRSYMPVAEIFYDDLRSSEAEIVLGILGAVADNKLSLAHTMQAKALIATMARRHADFHVEVE